MPLPLGQSTLDSWIAYNAARRAKQQPEEPEKPEKPEKPGESQEPQESLESQQPQPFEDSQLLELYDDPRISFEPLPSEAIELPEPTQLPESQASQPQALPSPAPSESSSRKWRRNKSLASVAKETLEVLPDILKDLPNIHARRSRVFFEDRLPHLDAADCPKRTSSGKTTIKIVNDDSFNAAIRLSASKTLASGRVAVLNMASHVSRGGGWLKGAMAQEEALCYRSSLYLSLPKLSYPWKQRQGIYSPDVVIIRSDQASGHKLLRPNIRANDLPVVSVLSIAALRTPPLDEVHVEVGGKMVKRTVFSLPSDRELTKKKMRLCLRMAAHHGHGLLVLGALGCGAFHNPPREVAKCWLEVLREAEFRGGWWEEVWFAVFDRQGEGNLEIFEEILGGVEV